jgi:hypothetical protein
MIYGTYLGGKGDEYGVGVALDSAGNAFITGSTRSSDFPTTANALQKGYGGTDYSYIPLGDMFLVKISQPRRRHLHLHPRHRFGGEHRQCGQLRQRGVAAGEIVVLTGSRIGPKALVTLAVVGGTKIATQIGTTQVLFDELPAPMLYASDTQTSAIVPYAVSGHTSTQLVVVFNGTRSKGLAVPGGCRRSRRSRRPRFRHRRPLESHRGLA